jgi:site-specific DNA recombinase
MTRTRMKPGAANTGPLRVVAYVRVSTEDQARSGLGLDAQKARCAAMATVKEWPAPVIYADEGISGTKDSRKRPGLAHLLADLDAGTIDAVIILSLDRLGRKTRLILDLVEEITQRAILVSCKESFDTQTPQGQFVLTIFAAFSQLERDLISQRTSAALAERSRRDGNTAGRIPYGYLRTPDGGVVVDPEAAQVVRKVFALHRSGWALRAIAESYANESGIPTPRGGSKWHHSTVRAILANQAAYAGGNRGASTVKWPAIIKTRRKASPCVPQ